MDSEKSAVSKIAKELVLPEYLPSVMKHTKKEEKIWKWRKKVQAKKEKARKTREEKIEFLTSESEESEEGESTQGEKEAAEEEYKLTIITREEWAAEERKEELAMAWRFKRLPSLIRVYSTGTPTCEGFENCCAAMQNIQKRDIEDKLTDIRYNFLISSDGLIFEGRGWTIIPDIQGLKYRRTCMLLGIIGEFMDVMPPKDALRSVGSLLTYGMKEKLIDHRFKILPFQAFKMPEPEVPMRQPVFMNEPEISFSEFEDLITDFEGYTTQ